MRKLYLLLTIALLTIGFQSSTFATEDSTEYKLIGFYNGLNKSEKVFSIGTASSEDGVDWGRSVTPLLQARENLFDSKGMNAPFPIQVGKFIYVYYAGYNGVKWGGIGLAIMTEDFRIISRPRTPVLKTGQSGSWDDMKVFRPYVTVTNNPDQSKRFMMYYTGSDSTGINKGGIAYSADGINWVKSSINPVISNGSLNDFDSQWAMPEYITKVNETYYMLYNGYDGDKIQTGYATSTNLEGPWDKSPSNPILKARSGSSQIITQDTVQGSDIVKVSSANVFHEDEESFLSSTAGTENVRVKEIVDANTVRLYDPIVYNHTVSGGAVLKSVLSRSVGPNQLEYKNNKWIVYGSAWGVIPTFETTTYAEGSSLDNLEWVYEKMPTLNYDTINQRDWDSISQENLKFIRFAR